MDDVSNIMLSEKKTYTHKNLGIEFHLYEMSIKVTNIETESQWTVSRESH